jgi:hypothetical protein
MGLHKHTPVDESIKKKIQSCKNMIKGRTAEAVVEELFHILGFEVHRYGMENSLPSLLHELGKFRGNMIIDKVRSLPDFIVTKEQLALEIEVKYRENGEFTFAELSEKYPSYPHVEVLFIVVSPLDLKCISYAQLKSGNSTRTGDQYFLGSHPDLKEYKTTIEYYRGFVKNLFTEGLRNAPRADA